MKVCCSLLILILFPPLFILAQQAQIDSLQKALSQETNDTSRILLLGALADRHLAYDPQQAKHYAEECLRLSRNQKFVKGELIALNKLGDYHFRQSNYAMAIEYATQALRLAERVSDSTAMADSYRLLGNTNTFGLKQYSTALDYQLKALAIYSKQHDKNRMASLYGSITWVYAKLNKEIVQAQAYADKGIALATEVGNFQMLSYNYNSKGLLYIQQGKLDSALHMLEKSIQFAKVAGDHAVIAYNKSIIGEIYIQQENFSIAVQKFNESLAESEHLALREIMKDSYSGLASGYEGLQQFERALKYHKLYVHLRDSLLNWETTQRALILQMGYEQELKEATIASLENENRQAQKEKRIIILVFGAGIFVFILILALILRNNRQRIKTSKLLKEKNDEIAAQNEELFQSREEVTAQRDLVAEQNVKLQHANQTKDRLLSIISHDLRGPLSSLKSLLHLTASEAVTVEELKLLIPNLTKSVHNLGEMLENLLQWSISQMKGLSSTPAILTLDTLIVKEIELFFEAAKSKKLTLDYLVPTDMTVYADENHLRLILRNLLHNAIKFTPSTGTVTIEASVMKSFVEITVRDTGVGIPMEKVALLFSPAQHASTYGTDGEKGTGLGLLLCKEIAEANGGSIAVTSEEGKGSTFYLRLPISKPSTESPTA